MSLERHLVLNRWLHSLLGADALEPLAQQLGAGLILEGPAGDGQSHFFRVLVGRPGLRIATDRLQEYDARVLDYEARLARGRAGLALKYFQYLTLLYTEILLDRLTDDPESLLAELNQHLATLQRRGLLTGFPAFEPGDLSRFAFFLATGSGKTLLLHANLWQVSYYLSRGRRSEALVRRPDERAEFEGVYLITPNEGLSRQHLDELSLSGIPARHLVLDPPSPPSLFGPEVRVVEISKLAEEPTGDGVSLPIESLGSANLVFVDEGHKGAGAESQVWKRRQKALSAGGMLFEYSATFAQAIGAASRRARESLLVEYGKGIVFDYSYRHFYSEQFGKDFAVLNLESAREEQAHDVLLGGLLLFYQQTLLFREHAAALRPYALEAPLWVFLGSKVNAVFVREGRTTSDVATAVEFLRRFLEHRDWAVPAIARVLAGRSGFRDPERGVDVFRERLAYLAGEAEELYDRICRDVFRGRGGLELWEIKNADGELGLRTTSPEDGSRPYFGVVNIGDSSGFKAHLHEQLGIEPQEDRFAPSLFGDVNRPGSGITMLLGAKKFLEGWSSWRVSTMALLNMGRGEGPQVIQLFGRGVRLRGRAGSLRRSAARPDPEPDAPPALRELETLYIVGWNADYLAAFREMLSREEILPAVEVPVRGLFEEVSELPVPRPRTADSFLGGTWTVTPDPAIRITVDLAPRATAMLAGVGRKLEVTDIVEVPAGSLHGVLDFDSLYAGLLEYKARRGYGNIHLRRVNVESVLHGCEIRMTHADSGDPARIQEGALRALTSYLDRFVARREREVESRCLEPGTLAVREHVRAYNVRPATLELLQELRDLVGNSERLYAEDDGPPLPRLHVPRHLWSPLLQEPTRALASELHIAPPGLKSGEVRFLTDLRQFWNNHHGAPEYRDLDLFVLRNPPGSGVGFFRRSGFFPDFIVWLKGRNGRARVRFVEPHGMHHGGLSGNEDKIASLRELDRLNRDPAFREAGLEVRGYLVTETIKDAIPGAERHDWDTLARDHRLLHQSGTYISTILGAGLGNYEDPLDPPVELDPPARLAVEAILSAAAGRVRRISLFGSRARGDARPDSDYDFLVLTKHADDVEAVTSLCQAASFASAIPRVDLHVMDLGTFERQRHIYGTLAYPASQDGMVVYDAGGS